MCAPTMGRTRDYCSREVLPFVAMVTTECTMVGMSTIYKAAVSKGLSYHIFMLYSYVISALVLLPLVFIFHRKTQLPPFNVRLLGKFIFLGALGFVAKYMGNIGIALTNPTLSSAMSNLLPAATFVLAIIFRMEKMQLGSISTQAKVVGTFVTIAGAFIVVLYKGPALIQIQAHDQKPNSLSHILLHQVHVQSSWILGGIILAAQYILVSVWYIYQAKVMKEYPAEMVLVFFFNLTCSVLSVVDCLINERDSNAWKIRPDIQLMSILYAGILGTGFNVIVHTWGIHVKGPVYVALFSPLSIAIAAIMGVIFLGDTLYSGCVIGSVIISIGFYTVIWGKSTEDDNDSSPEDYNVESLSTPSSAPFLDHYIPIDESRIFLIPPFI